MVLNTLNIGVRVFEEVTAGQLLYVIDKSDVPNGAIVTDDVVARPLTSALASATTILNVVGVALTGTNDDYGTISRTNTQKLSAITNGIVSIEAGASVSAGDGAKLDTDGNVITLLLADNPSLMIGRILDDGTDGDNVRVKLFL